MWPGMRCPGNTRDGKLEAPIETLHLEHVSVRLGSAAETVPANDTGKTTALGGPNHIDKPRLGENVYQHAVSGLGRHYAVCIQFQRDFPDHLLPAAPRSLRSGQPAAWSRSCSSQNSTSPICAAS